MRLWQDISKDGVSSNGHQQHGGCSIFLATRWNIGSPDIADSPASRGLYYGTWQCSQLSELDRQPSAWKGSKQEVQGQM